jgi:sugar lactone lactonase YvrE
MMFPNGSVITDDGRTLIVGETAGARYAAFTIGDDGALGDRRIWAQLAPTPELGTLEETLGRLRFGPDGCGLDAEEHIWSADEVNARCCRVAPGGEVVEEVPAPEGLDVFACMLGGEDGRTLLMCGHQFCGGYLPAPGCASQLLRPETADDGPLAPPPPAPC